MHVQQVNRNVALQKGETVDVALLLFNTMGSHLHSNDDARDCFNCSFEALKPGGLLIIELPPTRDVFDGSFALGELWEEPVKGHDDMQLILEYGTDDDEFDPETQASLQTQLTLLSQLCCLPMLGSPMLRKPLAKGI